MLATFRVLVIGGARQVGKSTLAATQLAIDPAHVFSVDDPAVLGRAVLAGGFPEVVRDQMAPRHRALWFDAYLDDVVNREALRPIAEVRYEHELRRLLPALAARIGTELVIADLARDLGLDRATVTNYVSLLEAVYLVHLLPAFAASATIAAKQRPKIHLVDSGVAAHLNGVGARDLSALSTDRLLGPMVEQFVVTEVLKQASRSLTGRQVLHYRDREGREADLVIEDRRTGRTAAIEVKASSSPDARCPRRQAPRVPPRPPR